MTAYVHMQLAHLAQLPKEKVLSGRFDFLPWEQVQETLEKDQRSASPLQAEA